MPAQKKKPAAAAKPAAAKAKPAAAKPAPTKPAKKTKDEAAVALAKAAQEIAAAAGRRSKYGARGARVFLDNITVTAGPKKGTLVVDRRGADEPYVLVERSCRAVLGGDKDAAVSRDVKALSADLANLYRAKTLAMILAAVKEGSS
jgi:hypothetical protein